MANTFAADIAAAEDQIISDLEDLIASAEADLGRDLTDEERQSLVDEYLAALDDATPADGQPDATATPSAGAGFADPATTAAANPPRGADVALGGPDGRKAEALLRRTLSEGRDVLATLARQAVASLLANHGEAAATAKVKRLFDAEQLGTLADQLAATNATAELLGRARIAARAAEVERRAAERLKSKGHHSAELAYRFSAEPTPWPAHAVHAFDESAGLTPMPPSEALAYFRRLFPSLGVDPQRFAPTLERQAFTLAVATDETLLTAIQSIIADRLATGEGISTAPADIDAILEAAGVAPANPQYSEMVLRTNAMDAYNTGSQRELSANAEMFPAWQYSNPSDTRSRPAHADRDGKYWPTDTPFVAVRGAGIEDAANCRCVQIPIDKFEWADLQAAGATLETGR